jgi:hypothetical protein
MNSHSIILIVSSQVFDGKNKTNPVRLNGSFKQIYLSTPVRQAKILKFEKNEYKIYDNIIGPMFPLTGTFYSLDPSSDQVELGTSSSDFVNFIFTMSENHYEHVR